MVISKIGREGKVRAGRTESSCRLRCDQNGPSETQETVGPQGLSQACAQTSGRKDSLFYNDGLSGLTGGNSGEVGEVGGA